MILQIKIRLVFFALSFPVLGQTTAILDIEKAPVPGQSLVWSPLFQDSWDKFNSMLGGLPEKVEPPNELTSRLDQFKWRAKDVMPKDGYATFVGPATPEFAKTTAAKVKEQFGLEMAQGRLPNPPGGRSLYGVLVRDLVFKKAFFRSKASPLKFKDSQNKLHEVSFFGSAGAYSDRFGSSVKVRAYQPQKKSFVLQIATDHKDETLIIFRPEKPLSFEKAIEQVTTAISAPLKGKYGSVTDDTLHKNDTVKIPYLSLNADTDFTDQLQGARFYPNQNQPWKVAKAYQITQFELSEKGAKIKNQTGMDVVPFGDPPKIKYIPRNFICDGPFFVFAWKDEADWPFFAAWIDGKDALQPFSKN